MSELARSLTLIRRSRELISIYLYSLAETWQKTELVEDKSDVNHAIYERIVIEGPRFVGLRLIPAAYRHGMALALPEAVMARPTGVVREISTHTLPIEGRDEWLAAAGLNVVRARALAQAIPTVIGSSTA